MARERLTIPTFQDSDDTQRTRHISRPLNPTNTYSNTRTTRVHTVRHAPPELARDRRRGPRRIRDSASNNLPYKPHRNMVNKVEIDSHRAGANM
jgi:hypothetical protein